ncbi:uncharacterized protein LOC111622242 [Centruroides sculpturatus]|uniref:uncharacterized protein LOC111622242 n=1 Tax=Centruroides sculpturatus TaxID=218467 RepID=UPI000C6CDCAC|nr:uncharacterized protein LOC111622242 [Centruroides sculpturatus]
MPLSRDGGGSGLPLLQTGRHSCCAPPRGWQVDGSDGPPPPQRHPPYGSAGGVGCGEEKERRGSDFGFRFRPPEKTKRRRVEVNPSFPVAVDVEIKDRNETSAAAGDAGASAAAPNGHVVEAGRRLDPSALARAVGRGGEEKPGRLSRRSPDNGGDGHRSGGTRCSDDPLAGKAWSVYLVDGPKLGPAVLEIRPGPTYAGEGLTVKVQLEVTGTEKGVRLRLFVTWEMDERCSAREIVEVTEKGLSGLAWTAKIPSPGTHVIGVVVDAGEGVVSARRRVTVSPPIPSGLKVTLHPEVKETPTCVPSHLPPGHVTVYTGRKARLVASVETGCDPTFSWRVDEEDPWESGPFPGGSGLSLRRSVLEHTFGREGVHRVSVNVSNLHGWVHRSISVVAVDYRMSDAVLRSRNGHRHPSDSRVTFLLTVFTTHHVATRLLLRPGDGTQLRHTLQVGADDRDVSVRHDRRCRLSAEIHHTYNEEGEFHPLALVDDGTVRIEARTSRVLKVCHRLDHGTLSGKGVIPTGSSLKLALHLNTRSLCDIRVDWRLLESNRTVLFSKNRKIEWSPRIRRAGTYTVVSTAKNPVGNVTFRHEVKVQDPVRRLSIRGIGSYYPTGIPFRLVAVIGGGSHVTCGWSTGSHSDWHKWEGHGGCRAIWTFYKAGNKKIELEAGNLVGRKKTGGRITVVEPIHGVYVSLEDPASSKRPLRIEVLVLKGSHLNVTFDGGMVTRVGRGRFLLTGSEPSPGRHILDLVLSNPVGEHRTRVEMRTRSPLSEDLRPTILLQSAYRDSATYRVDFSGSSTEKLLYRWKAPCCQPLYTSLPIVDWKWTRHVQLTVVNAISSVTVEAAIPEPETRIPTLLHSSVVEVGRPINFSLQNLEPDPYRRIDVTYSGDGWTDERTFSSNAGPESWTHIFHRAGWVDIRVTQFSDRLWISNFTLSSRLNVQYPLGKIHVLGPRLVPYLDRFAILGCWRAAISPESDIGVVYAWKVEDEWKITAESEVSLSLSRPGSHVIEVKAWNGVSRLATLLTVIAVPVVTEVSLRVLPVHVGRVSEFRISYVGSSSCNVSVSFGDGSWRTIYYFRSDRSQPGLFTLPVLHKYGRKGDYPVVVNVSNQISWMTTRRMAHVGELISGVILTLLTPSPVPLTVDVGLVVVRATVASGTDLKFKWEFRDNDGDKYTSVESNETVSVARHGYGIAETYNVSVEVSNPFGKVVAYLDAPVRVVEPIRQLRLRPVGDIWAAPLLVGGSEPPITPPVTFEAQVYWGSDVEFLFDFGDGNGTSVPAQLGTLSLRPTAQCTHYYRREKAYTVKVTASNPLGSVSMTLPDLFYVQIPPKGLELNRKYYITVLGEPIVLGATVTAGTNVSYDWYLGDNIVYSKRGPEIVLNFDKIGKYNVTVQAYNKVTNLSPNIDHLFASTNVYVQEPLQGVEICIMIKEEIICEGNNVSLPSDEEVTMVAHVLPSDETALKFLWDLGLGELRKTNSPSLRYNYREPGIYVANITALNHVSMVLSGQIVIHVVQKVGNLTSIRHSGSILVNRTTIFHAQYWFGTNLTFEWDFGDGTKKLITSSDKVQHTYTSVGEYWMTVIAHNKYSCASLKTNVFVLYQFCQKPQIKFIDQTIEKKIQYNHDIMLEVDLTTSCELSNDVLYFWKVFDERQKEMNFSEEITTQRQLIIPKEILPIGKYIIELKKGVEICIMIKEEIICEGNNVSLPSDEEVTMVAHVLPSDETALKFLWDLGLGELRKTNSPSLRYNYREPGIYVANITALNHVSMVLSGQIVIHVVQKVGNLTSIRHSGSILVNRTTIFHAQYWFGTNLTFEWDFGDGTKKLITSSDKVQHTYTSVGEYWMTVIAHNKYSCASLKTNVFVLYQFCQKPQIKFIDQTIEKKIQYNHDIMLEVDLTTSCELSNDVLYFWKVFDERQKEMNFSEEITTQRQLIIPKEILPIGKYIIELKVQMNRTMVYAIETTEITIVPSNIIAIWEGGILRQVGFEDDITLNIISNVNLEETNCSLNWYCTSFPFNHQQCFKNGSSSGTITRFFPSINFHVGLLNLKLSAVSFKLNIYHDRKLQASMLQELEITEKSHMLPILIKRYNHFSHVVRQDTRLIFLAICKGCRDVKLEFQWKLWLVQDGNHNLYISEHNCVQADGSTFFIHADNITTAKPMNPTGHWTLESTNSKEESCNVNNSFRYFFQVQMNRTMVYAIETTEITIVPSNIIAIWEGGILRQVGFEDDITLNIISNVNLEETNCSLNWYCTSFPFNHQQCFKNGSSSGTITRFFPSINFHVGLLNLKLSAVSFKLNIYHDRKLQASTLQELEITEKSHMLPILIKRYNHFSHVVRQDTRLIFLAICKGCRDVKLEFQWKLWLVQDGNHNLYISEHNCVQADGSTFFIHADNITTAKPMNPTGHWTLESTNSKEDNLEEEFPPFPKFPGLPEVKKWQSFVENTDRKKRETFQQTGDDFEEKDEATNPPFFPFPPVEGDVTYEASHLHLPEEFAAQELISDSFYPFEEGNPGEGGSAFAREHNLQQLEKSEEKILEEIGKGRYGTIKNNQNDDDYNGEFNLPDDIGHAAVDGRYPSTAPHVIRRPRIPLSSESNLVSPEYFILEPRSLKIGSTYIVEATVTSKDNPELMGKAMDYVIVNIGPTNGRCTLIPLEGREFATWFRLHCMEWRTEYHPLWYELHYTQIPNATGHLVYVGLNGNAKFTLPAGLPEYNHNVYVDVVVRDGSGSGTRVCSIVRKVYPEWEDSEDLKLFIVNETTSSQSSFNKMLGEKNYQGLLHQIHVWVTGLNRVDANFTKRKRRETNRDNLRQELINLIGSLKLNTLAEAHQALQALLPLLDAPSQILVKDLTTSFELIQKFNERKSLHINFPVKTFQESLLRVTSQIIYLSSILLEDAELAKDITLKSLLEKSIIIMRNAIKKNASSLIPNDRPYVFETSHVVFFYSRIATDNPEPIIKFGENEIILGRQMYLDLFNVSDRDNLLSCRKSYPFICDCVEIMAESFANGLYVNGNNWINTGISSKWNGGISSVNFHSCDVQDHVHVTNPNVEFHLKRLKMNLGKEYTLSKDNIHIHQLNLTKDQVNKSLIISLDIQDFEKKHLFPLCLLFSSKQPPQPTKYMKKVSSKHHEKTMKLFIPNYLVKEPGLYYLTVLDGHFSKHSRQNIDFSPITYTLQTWLEQCVSWDGHRQHWSSDRCIVLETTNIDSVHCSCKSIGPTSYYTWNLATNLEIASVDKFLSSMIHLLPVIFIIFTYVLILIICHFYGAHDRKRAPLIDLKDNSHKYGYLMIIETGFYWNAGTTAMVCVVLHGENGMSETTSLVNRDSNHALFRRGSINTFYISTQSNLGNLWKLQIWHNNGGASPSWFLKNIMVFDMHTGKSYYFECEQWLSVEEEDGQIEKELPLNEISWNLSKVYRETFIHYLCDYHLWSSVCLKPPYSSFSRAQRLTCCFSLIVSSAALIAVWYKYQHFQYYVEYGLPDSSWQTLAVGIISGLFVMVPHQFISALFRNSQASQMTLFKYFRPICSDWSWKSLYCSYQQKEANSTEASSESFSTSNSRSIYTADSLSHFEESLDSDDDSSREQFLLMDGNNADLYNLYNKNQYRRHSWDSYDDIGNSIEEELFNSYKKREYQSEANERIKSARRKEMNCSEQTSSGFEDWPDKTVEDANYEEFYHPGTIPLPLLSRMQKIVLPCWVQTVAWIFLLTIASFSTYITMSYVYRFGDHYFNCWLQSLFYNILASVFLLHPLWISLLSIPVSIRTWLLGDKESFISLRVNVSLIEEIVRVDYQLKNSPEYFGGEEEKLMKRQRARYLRYLRPPPEQTLIEARRKALETKFVLKSIKSICLSLMTIVLLIVIAFGNDTNHYYRQNVSIQNAFLRASKNSFFNIRSHSAWWKWIQNDFLDGFYGVENSNGVLQQRTEFDSLLSTGCIPVGTVSIRQHRVTSQPCLELYHYFSSEKCFPSYSKHYGYIGSNKTLGFDNPWMDKSVWGRHGLYIGDGEAIILGKTSRKAALDELERLQSKNWVNNSSRALIVEFLLYNPTLSLYIPVSILTEFTAVGSVEGSFSALPCHLYRYSTTADSVILASQFIFLILILWMVKEEVWKMWKIGHSYWLSPWKYLQASFCLLSLSYLSCHVYRSVLVTAAIQNQQFPVFVSHISEVAYWDQILNGQLGVLIFIYALSRLKLLNISVKTKQFLQVFKFIQKETLMAVLLSALLLVGFAHIGNLAFGSDEFNFKSPVFQAWRALRSTLRQSPVTRYPDSASYGAEVYAVVLLFGMLGWLALGMAMIKAVMMRSKRQIRPKREKGLEAGEAARLILRSLGMAKKERKDSQCREKSSPPAELLLMELETLVDDIFVYANKLFSDIDTHDDYIQLEEKVPVDVENSKECHRVVAELHHCSTENSLDKDEDRQCGYQSTNGSDNETVDSCQ